MPLSVLNMASHLRSRAADWLWVVPAAYIALVAVFFRHLPASIPTRFSSAGAPTAWSSPLAVVLATVVLLVATAAIQIWPLRHCRTASATTAELESGFAYLILGLEAGLSWALLTYAGAHSVPKIVVPALTAALLGAALGRSSHHPAGKTAPRHDPGAKVLGVQVHSSRLQSVILIVAVIVPLGLSLVVRGPVRLVPIAVTCIIGYFGMLTVQGFRYTVFADALQINWGPRKLKLIPAGEITDLKVVSIDPLGDCGGWGLRCVSDGYAYILKGTTAVKVSADENYYLGTEDPDGLLALLRAMHPAPAVV